MLCKQIKSVHLAFYMEKETRCINVVHCILFCWKVLHDDHVPCLLQDMADHADSDDSDLPLSHYKKNNTDNTSDSDLPLKTIQSRTKKKKMSKALSKALRLSKRMHKKLDMEKKIHEEQLERTIKANNLILSKTPEDGDCFFVSVLKQIYELSDPDICRVAVEEIRFCLAEHIKKYLDKYRPFITNSLEIDALKTCGKWDQETCDLVPTVLATMLQKKIVIFTSIKEKPILHLLPLFHLDWKEQFGLCEFAAKEKPVQPSNILLAFPATHGHEHYDVLHEGMWLCFICFLCEKKYVNMVHVVLMKSVINDT